MFHLNTEQLIDYWRARRGADPVPRRAAIELAHLVNLAPQIFMLGREAAGQYHFRLVGGFVAELHGRDLRQVDFLRLWRPGDRPALQMALEAVRRRGEPMVVDCDAHAEADLAMRMEITLAPLIGPNGEPDRFIGLHQPISPVATLNDHPVHGLSVRDIATPGAVGAALPRMRLATVQGTRIA